MSYSQGAAGLVYQSGMNDNLDADNARCTALSPAAFGSGDPTESFEKLSESGFNTVENLRA